MNTYWTVSVITSSSHIVFLGYYSHCRGFSTEDVAVMEPNKFAIRWRIAGTANVPFPGLKIKPYIVPRVCTMILACPMFNMSLTGLPSWGKSSLTPYDIRTKLSCLTINTEYAAEKKRARLADFAFPWCPPSDSLASNSWFHFSKWLSWDGLAKVTSTFTVNEDGLVDSETATSRH